MKGSPGSPLNFEDKYDETDRKKFRYILDLHYKTGCPLPRISPTEKARTFHQYKGEYEAHLAAVERKVGTQSTGDVHDVRKNSSPRPLNGNPVSMAPITYSFNNIPPPPEVPAVYQPHQNRGSYKRRKKCLIL